VDTAAQREYWALELGHAVDALGVARTTRTQTITFLGTANLLVLGTALSVSKAGICLVASAIAVLLFLVDSGIRWNMRIYQMRGIVLQRRLSYREPDTFMQMQASRNPRAIQAHAKRTASASFRSTSSGKRSRN
jgi:hypothetical protein